jgi:hypothetical protein
MIVGAMPRYHLDPRNVSAVFRGCLRHLKTVVRESGYYLTARAVVDCAGDINVKRLEHVRSASFGRVTLAARVSARSGDYVGLF